MLDLKFVRDNVAVVEEALRKRRSTLSLEGFVALDRDRRERLVLVEGMRAERNAASEEIGRLRREKKDASALMERMKELSSRLKEAEAGLPGIEGKMEEFLLSIPNIPDPAVPEGAGEEDNPMQPYQNAVQITVAALATGPRPGLGFEGRLEGSGSGWVPIEPGRPTMLLNLQPGAYRFVARATASGRSGPSTVSVAFTILRPWWLRPWAIVLEALVLLGFAAGAYNVRVRHLLALERVRSRIASDLHDDIGTSLSRVALISEAARGHRSSDREAVALGALGVVATTARSLASDVADLAWASDPHEDTLANVIGRASWFGSELFVIRGTEWRCTVDESRLNFQAGSNLPLIISGASAADTTLVVNGPDGSWYCDDDGGVNGLNPSLRFGRPPTGRYEIWVGTYGGASLQNAHLHISELYSQ